jgi:hypothetical protein
MLSGSPVVGEVAGEEGRDVMAEQTGRPFGVTDSCA